MDYRSGTGADIYAQRINASGVVQWTANGVAISTPADDDQRDPTIVSDGAGGAIITWHDSRSGALNYDIYAQRINASGVVQWTVNGVAISTAPGNQVYPTITSDGAGGAINTWSDGRSGTNADIYAQRINASGVVQWTANGVAISTAARDQLYPTITSDGAGGAIITWYDYRSGTNYDIYAQQVSANGQLGVVTIGSLSFQYPRNDPYIFSNDYSYPQADGRKHTGVDVHQTSAGINGPVLAVAQGEVVGIFRPIPGDSGYVNAYTNYPYPHYDSPNYQVFAGERIRDHNMQGVVIVKHTLPAGGLLYSGTIYSLYAHLASISTGLAVGQTVTRGAVLGNTGGDGNRHVHLEIKSQPFRHDPARNWPGSTGRVPYWGYTPPAPNSPNDYGYYDPWIFVHTISAVSPTLGQSGTTVTIDGSRFSSLTDSANAKIEFAGVRANVVSFSDTRIRVVAPAGSGAAHVRLAPTRFFQNQSLPGGSRNWMVFVYQPVYVGDLIVETPIEFRLHRNYPNPFNPTTTIRYGLPARSVVRVAIYNVLGQVVSELVNGEQDAGYYDVQWTPNAPSGVYFYRLEAGEFVETKKLVLLR